MRSEFQDIEDGFDKMPSLTAGTAVVVNGAGTALSNTVGTLALAGNFATTGAFATTLVQQANATITLPLASGTLATLAGVETLSNKTLIAPALGTPASGVATNLTGTAAGLTAGNVTLSNLSGTASGLTAGHVTTNANLTGPITSSGNATAVASQTGSGSKFVMDTSPSLITPNIGDATASTINGNTIAAGSDAVVLLTASQTLTNKTLTAAALGNSTATTQAANNNSTRVATTAYLDSKLAVANGIATLDSSGTLTAAQIPASLLGATVYKGVWNATTNTPTLVSSVGVAGNYYIVNVAGTTTLDGISSWSVGDTAIFSGTVWNKIASTAGVTSVAGKTGAVTLAASDLTNGTTGSGAVVLANSPTLVTPALGIATATSLAIGGASLGSDALAITGSVSISGSVALGANALLSWNGDTFLSRQTTANVQFGGLNAAVPVPQIVTFQSVLVGTSNTSGADATIVGSRSTGTGDGGRIIFQTSPAGSTGTARNNAINAAIIGADQSFTAVGNLATSAARLVLGSNAQIKAVTTSVVAIRNAADTQNADLTMAAATISGILNYGGVNVAGSVTGTGSMVLSASPTFTGSPLAPTQTINDNSTKIATTAYADRTGVRQVVSTQTGTAITTAGTGIPYDNTIPQITEGDEIFTRSITPTSATSTLEIVVTVLCSRGNADTIIAALFQDSTTDALKAAPVYTVSGDTMTLIQFTYVMTSGTTSPTTFRVRVGSATPSAIRVNGISSGQVMGGVCASSIVITEIGS